MGLLRPATPLTVILLLAFVLLLLSTLTTPIIPAIPLGAYQGYNFGVFGYCKGSQCSPYQIGYTTDGLFNSDNAGNFELPSSTRHSLSAILIIHPIAAFLTLVCFGLAMAAHFHAPSHSPRYLLGLLILTIPTLLVTLLAFLVDILLFVPHMQWGGWIVLAATILIIASSVVTCAMRRTLVSRKARKKRIAENADMSGANYYENIGNVNRNRLMADELPRADSPPPMSGSTAVDAHKQGLAQFATFEMKRQDTRSGDSDERTTPTGLHDDRTPLNPTRDPSVRSASTGGGRRPYGPPCNEDAPPMPMGRQSMDSNGAGRPRRPSRDQYGNPILAGGAAMAMASDLPPPGLRHEGSQGSLGSNRSAGYQRGGRAGYGPPGRGYGPPRGGYGPPRGGYGPPRGAFRGQGPPPPGWRGRGGYGPPSPGMGGGGMPRQGPPPGYGAPPNDPYYNGPHSAVNPTLDGPPPPMRDEFMAGRIGQAIEMDERTGSPPGPLSPHAQNPSPYGLRDSDGDVAGMVGLQQGRGAMMRNDSERSEGVRSATSVYSDQTYVPPRAQWAQHPGLEHQDSGSSNPLSSNAAPSSRALPLSPIQGSPPTHRRGGSEAYYEDVDPRFAIDPASEVGHDQAGPLPTALTPGTGYIGSAFGSHPNNPPYQRMPPQPQSPNHLQTPSSHHNFQASPSERSNIPSYVSGSGDGSGGDTDKGHSTPSLEERSSNNNRNISNRSPAVNSSISNTTPSHNITPSSEGTGGPDHSYEHLPAGARSPGEGSEASHFTSVSQRPVNPNWRPAPGSVYGQSTMGPPPSSASAQMRRREDVILNANPDFSLPGMSPRGRGRGGGGGGGRDGGMGMGRLGSPTQNLGLTPGGRYPTDI